MHYHSGKAHSHHQIPNSALSRQDPPSQYNTEGILTLPLNRGRDILSLHRRNGTPSDRQHQCPSLATSSLQSPALDLLCKNHTSKSTIPFQIQSTMLAASPSHSLTSPRLWAQRKMMNTTAGWRKAKGVQESEPRYSTSKGGDIMATLTPCGSWQRLDYMTLRLTAAGAD